MRVIFVTCFPSTLNGVDERYAGVSSAERTIRVLQGSPCWRTSLRGISGFVTVSILEALEANEVEMFYAVNGQSAARY